MDDAGLLGGNGWGLLASLLLLLLEIAVIVRAITRPHRTASSRVAWVAVILFLPLVGLLAYLFLGETSIGAERIRRLRAAEAAIPRPDQGSLPRLDETTASVFAMVGSVDGFAPTAGNTVVLQRDSNAAVDRLVSDIEAATSSVHICFYIWLDDGNGTRVAEAVAAAARRGVACRVMIDALGSRKFRSSAQWRLMGEAGVDRQVALRDVPRLGTAAIGRPDLRNHRKIVVIDDRIAYCGSQNCADPEFRVKPKFAPWVDVLFRITGPIVAQQQWLFLTSWAADAPAGDIATTEIRAARPATTAPDDAGPHAVAAVFGTGPTARTGAMSDVFVSTIAAARRRLVITTPYFVPDEPLLAAICAAPRRGVDTTLILPARNDSGLVAAAARSTYPRLLEAGVKLFEYTPGLLHSKTLTVDENLALVGSANMDRRSLELNYENNLLLSGDEVTRDVLDRQLDYLASSVPVDLAEVEAWPLWRRLVQNTVGMLSPLL